MERELEVSLHNLGSEAVVHHAHPPTFRKFLKRHVNYGIGALRCHPLQALHGLATHQSRPEVLSSSHSFSTFGEWTDAESKPRRL